MKVFFEDGALGVNYDQLPHKPDIQIDAGFGASRCEQALKNAKTANKQYLYTNYLGALHSDYCWNEETERCDNLYFYSPSKREWIVLDLFKTTPCMFKEIYKLYLKGLAIE